MKIKNIQEQFVQNYFKLETDTKYCAKYDLLDIVDMPNNYDTEANHLVK